MSESLDDDENLTPEQQAERTEHIKVASRNLGASPYSAAAIASKDTHSWIDTSEYIEGVAERGQLVSDGDLTPLKKMLFAQAKMLDLNFYKLLGKANRLRDPELALKYMQTAIKLQSASRATSEAINEMVNPKRVLFAQQANIAHQQIVQNGDSSHDKKITSSNQNELQQLEVIPNATLDTRSSIEASRTNANTMPRTPNLGKIHRSQNT